jgi:hypothetical protein
LNPVHLMDRVFYGDERIEFSRDLSPGGYFPLQLTGIQGRKCR